MKKIYNFFRLIISALIIAIINTFIGLCLLGAVQFLADLIQGDKAATSIFIILTFILSFSASLLFNFFRKNA